jgi:hypothetical protein
MSQRPPVMICVVGVPNVGGLAGAMEAGECECE